MNIKPTKIKDVFIIETEILKDERGWFTESYNKKKLAEAGINVDFVQSNHSFTKNKGTLRGMHFQHPPHSQSKLVRCIRGAILDVAIDLRKKSPTYKQYIAIELTDGNQTQLFIPKGFAHGFLTLTDDAEVNYKIDNHYNKDYEGFLHFNDPEINIAWGVDNPILNERDSSAPFLKDLDINF